MVDNRPTRTAIFAWRVKCLQIQTPPASSFPGMMSRVDISPVARQDRPRRLQPLVATLVGVGALVLLLAFTFLGWRLSGGHRADFVSWLEAVATGLALAAAAIAAVLAASAFFLESDREDRWQETQEREQASTVAAWPGRVNAALTTTSPVAMRFQRSIEYDGVYIRNASQVPVTNVRAVALDQRGTVLGYVHKQVLPPNVEAGFYRWDEATRARITGLRRERQEPENDWQPEVDLYFTDAAGKFWHRASLGILRRRRLGDPLPEPRRS